MIRLAVVALALAALSGCTLLLPTQDLIQPCVAQEDCADGFLCEDNACLPEDEDPGSN
jgi:hypothetical protein